MSLQIINDGACLRIQNDTVILLITKAQIKTIDTDTSGWILVKAH